MSARIGGRLRSVGYATFVSIGGWYSQDTSVGVYSEESGVFVSIGGEYS